MTDKQIVCDQCNAQYRLTPDRNIAVHENVPLHRNRDCSYECPQCGTSIALASIWQPARVTFWEGCRSLVSDYISAWKRWGMAVMRTISTLRRQV